jgi:hypothetical protein
VESGFKISYLLVRSNCWGIGSKKSGHPAVEEACSFFQQFNSRGEGMGAKGGAREWEREDGELAVRLHSISGAFSCDASQRQTD